ncbi:cell division protein ZapA [Salibacterium salarium]|uniref:Cell division protein ZapA n=1 Tax=Salibacterium salarium TaxID=284579 RepID=A0A3R9Q3R5_9BACI|nr:cell division protein ZapA [Salibacterium salarium]RSL32993.1 cell division protein ZapA [Salibacterium salarium]
MDEDKEKQRTTVTIFGQPYTIVGDEPPEHVISVAEQLDQKMREFKRHNPYLDTSRLAVLTALNIVDDYMKLKQSIEENDRNEKEDR